MTFRHEVGVGASTGQKAIVDPSHGPLEAGRFAGTRLRSPGSAPFWDANRSNGYC